MKEIDISDDSLEDLLAYDDLFLDYFNAFLSLPAFAQPLEYDRLSGAFEELPVAALASSGDGTNGSKAGQESATPTARRHPYGATDAERESQLTWARTERLPLFVRTPLFRELKLIKLLLRRLDDRRSGSSRLAPRGGGGGGDGGSSSHIRGYSRQTGTYASSLSNSGDNSCAADEGAAYDDYYGGDEYNDRWDGNTDENGDDDTSSDAGAATLSRPSSLPPRLGLLASDDRTPADARRAAAANRRRIAKRAEGIADESDETAAQASGARSDDAGENSGEASVNHPSNGNKRSLSAPVNYREFLRMPMYADFDDIFMNEETDYDGHAYLSYGDGRGDASDEQTETDVRALEGELQMTMQQLKERALAKRSHLADFRRFLRDTPALALLEFWLECENFKDRMEDFDDVENMAMRNQLFRDIQDKYRMSLTEEAKRQIARASSSYQLSHAVFIRTQYDVLRRLRAYWVPRYILHRQKTRALAELLGEQKQRIELPDGGEKYCASFLPAVSVVGSFPVRHDLILDLTRSVVWAKVSRALSAGRVRSGRRYSGEVPGGASATLAQLAGPSLRDMMLVSIAADADAGGPFANYLCRDRSSEPYLHSGLLFLEEVAGYTRAEDRSADRLLRMNRAWTIYNCFLADGCRHRIAVSSDVCDAAHRALLASPDYVEASIFDDAKQCVTAYLERPWVDFLRDDARRFWECRRIRGGDKGKEGASASGAAVGEFEVLALRDYPRIVVRRPPTVKFPKLRLDSRAAGRRAVPAPLYLTEEERQERRRLALARRRELQKEQRRVLREFRRRKEAEKQRVLIDLNARKGQPNAAADGGRGKSGGATDEEGRGGDDDEDGYYSRRSGARASTVHDGGSRGRRSTAKDQAPPTGREITFRDFAGNRPIMSLFKKYLAEHEIKDQVNMVMLHNEIESYMQLDARPHLKRDMQSTFVYKTYIDKHSKKAVPLPDRFYARLTGHERDCPRTPTLTDIQRHVAGELDVVFRQFFEHQADTFGVDSSTLASMTQAELALRSETDAALAKAYARKPGKNKKTGKAPPTKEDKAEFMAELSRCQANGGRPTLTMMFFQKYLIKHTSDEDGGSQAARDLAFYLEVQKFKELTHAYSDDELVRRKVLAIVDCFLESPISPPCQIDISQDLCAKVTKTALRYAQGKEQAAAAAAAAVGGGLPGGGGQAAHTPSTLFDEAHVAVFKELLPYWAGFFKQYKPPENAVASETPLTKQQKELRKRYEDFVNAQAPSEHRLTLPAIVAIVAKASALSYSLTEGLKPAKDEEAEEQKPPESRQQQHSQQRGPLPALFAAAAGAHGAVKGYEFEDDHHHHHAHTLPRPDSEASVGGRVGALRGAAAAAHHGSRKNLALQGIKETEAT